LHALWVSAEELRARHGPGTWLWSYEVNNRFGAVIAVLLRSTRVTPNRVTLLGLVVHVAGSLYVALLDSPVSFVAMLPALAAWQLAYSLDCADGLLARETGQASSLGAWLDQLADGAAHVSVFVALSLFLVRALALGPVTAVLLGALATGVNLILLFGWMLRQILIGEPTAQPGISRPRHRIYTLLRLAFGQLADYGAFILVASVLLLAPPVLLVYICVSTLVWGVVVARMVTSALSRSRA
jgi:phosphatidylglycerophosphate synthase